MKQYLELVQEILDKGEAKDDRTGTGTISMFGAQKRYDLRDGFPMVTTKKTIFKSVIYELLWFLKGIYKKTHINQIQNCIDLIKNDPKSRRIIVSAWNVADLDKMALAPCHAFFQFYVADGKLSCQLYQRSADIFLGVPFNIASYALLTMMMSQVCGLEPGDFVHTFGDAHLYSNHMEQTREQLSCEPRPLPAMRINPEVKNIFGFRFEDFTLEGYDPHPAIKAPVAI